MRILLDECVDRRLARDLGAHDVATVVDMGWAGTRNGALLRRAAERFDALVTVDRNLAFQQPLLRIEIAVFVLRAFSNRWVDLHPLVPTLLRALEGSKPGTATWIGPAPRARTARK